MHGLTALVRMTRGRVAKQVPKKHPCAIGIRAAPLTCSRASRRPAPMPSAACATTPGKPLGHDKHRRSDVTLDAVQDPCELAGVRQDERHLPAPVLRHGFHAFHVHRAEQRAEVGARNVWRVGVAKIPKRIPAAAVAAAATAAVCVSASWAAAAASSRRDFRGAASSPASAKLQSKQQHSSFY